MAKSKVKVKSQGADHTEDLFRLRRLRGEIEGVA